MKQLTPIPTIYNGVKFRSRLEARWAVFFDQCGIEWEYEKEGYQLKSGWYVPDFWIPSMKIWVEVKPPGVACTHAMALHDETTFPVLVTCGMPDQGGIIHITDSHGSSGGYLEIELYAWGIVDKRVVLVTNYRDDMSFFNSDWTRCKSVIDVSDTRSEVDVNLSIFRSAINYAKKRSFWK